jgi:hypothetical protein
MMRLSILVPCQAAGLVLVGATSRSALFPADTATVEGLFIDGGDHAPLGACEFGCSNSPDGSSR